MQPTHIVLLPGMMLTNQLFAHQLAMLGESHEAAVVDLTQSSTIADLATDALRSAPPQFALVGLSLGGIVCFEMWRQAPERITHLALLDTTPYADSDERRVLRNEQMARVGAGALRDVL